METSLQKATFQRTAGVLAAGDLMEIYNTSAVHINRLIKWLHCFKVSFLQKMKTPSSSTWPLLQTILG